MKELSSFIPEESLDYVLSLLQDCQLVISKPRSTKLGDFKPNTPLKGQHTISINSNLNQYSFLITLIHEIAHLKVWNEYGNKVKPHGKEWKSAYKNLMLPLLNNQIFPDNVLRPLSKYLINPSASSGADVQLYFAIEQYSPSNSDMLLLHSLPDRAIFELGNTKKYVKGDKLRKRFKCTELSSGLVYLIHPTAKVKIVEK